MTEEERQAILTEAFPSSVQGYTRGETVASDFPYAETFPPFVAKDKVIYTLTNLIIRQLLSNDKQLKMLINNLVNQLANCDIRLVTQAIKGVMSPEDKIKLDSIESYANRYTHPASGVNAGSYNNVIVNEQGHVTGGSNPTTLAGYGITDAANKNHGNHVPALETANNARFLRNDDSWQTITPTNIGAYTTAQVNELLATKSGKLGNWVNGAASGTADCDMFICAISASNTDIRIYVGGVLRMHTAGRDKYGQGPTSICCPVAKNQSYSVTGAQSISIIKFNA